MRILGALTWRFVLSLALLSRISDFVFVSCSQLLSLVPYLFGVILQYES